MQQRRHASTFLLSVHVLSGQVHSLLQFAGLVSECGMQIEQKVAAIPCTSMVTNTYDSIVPL